MDGSNLFESGSAPVSPEAEGALQTGSGAHELANVPDQAGSDARLQARRMSGNGPPHSKPLAVSLLSTS